jgi:tripartite-type tricarboxylate transporter receptor subunit TctC
MAVAPSLGGCLPSARSESVALLPVGFPAGATGDRIARAVVPVLAPTLGTAVIVDNMPGAGGQLAIEIVKKAPAQSDIVEHCRTGKLRVLVVTGMSRTTRPPEVPTFPELDHPNLVNREWSSHFLTTNTPGGIVSTSRVAVRKAAASDEVRKKLPDAGLGKAEGDATSLAATMQKACGQRQRPAKETRFVAN